MNYTINSKSELENFITHNWNKINDFLDTLADGLELPFYNSVDIRESKNKFAPVDNNLYPAGFNNVCFLDLNITAERMKNEILKLNPQAKRIAIIPESHTKNLFYLDHLFTLASLPKKYDFEVDIISPDEKLFEETDELDLISKSEYELKIIKGWTEDNEFKSKNGSYDLIILNNDQSQPLDVNWNEINNLVYPTPNLGWRQRTKANHFIYYKKIADQFSNEFSINPDLLQARFKLADDIDFHTKEGLDNLAAAVSEIKSNIQDHQNIFIKANQGTYGMGIMVVDGPEDVLSMNRKIRNKMNIGKNKLKFTSVIVQEGVETVLTHDGGPAEVTIYIIGGKPVGGFLRANPLKDSQGNLNAKGMVYQKFCISEIHEGHDHKAKEGVYSILARISTIAAGHEILESKK